MKMNFSSIMIGAVLSLAVLSVITGELRWGLLASFCILIAGAKWLRLKKQEDSDEIEYDERVNENIKKYSSQSFAISNLILLVYLLISDQILNEVMINVNYLILYLGITFAISFYIVPLIARKK